MITYSHAYDYPSPHGRHLQEFYQTGSRLLKLANGELWVVTDDGGAILFDDFEDDE